MPKSSHIPNQIPTKKPSSNESAKVQIRNLLIVIGSAVLLAFGVAAFMVNAYGPTGNYTLSNILLSPEAVRTMAYQQLVFDHIEYAEWDLETHVWKRRPVSIEEYQKFFTSIESAESENSSNAPQDPFSRRNPSTLTIFVRPQAEYAGTRTKIFQVVQIVPDYFRVELHADNLDENSKWVYFYYPAIQELATKTFGKGEK